MAVRKLSLGSIAALVAGLLTACATGGSTNNTQFATSLAPPDPSFAAASAQEYRISPNDKLSISVFPDTTMGLAATRVDAGGSVLLPAVGMVEAKGKTARELSRELETKLGACCLQKPKVVVLVEETTSQQIWVTGAVVASDVYNLKGPTTLVQAITMAKGPDRATANLKQVVIQRVSNGQRTHAKFDVKAILDGRAEDPQVFGGDTIIVDSSAAKSIWRNAVSVVPLFGVFTAF